MLRCSCGTRTHVAHLCFDPMTARGNNLKEEGDDSHLGGTLDSTFPFWHRAWLALKYIFAARASGLYFEIVLKNGDVARVADFIKGKLVESDHCDVPVGHDAKRPLK